MERRLSRALAAVVVGVAAFAVPVPVPALAAPGAVRLAPGVALRHSSFRWHGVREQLVTLSITLSKRTRLVAASPGDVIGARRMTTLALARQERALAGINGDVFYLSDPAAIPRGGITHEGRTLKSALVGKQAVLYVTAAGVAAIGDPGFAGLVRTADGRHSFKIRSVNSLENARNGALTITDRRLLTAALPSCTVVDLTPQATGYRIVGVRNGVRRYPRRAGGDRALVTCGAHPKDWVQANLHPGDTVSVTTGYAVPRIRTLIGGARVLIRSGRRYDDRSGLLGYGTQRKPETFACVFRGGRRVLLGAFQGGRRGAFGITYAQLTSYLLSRSCWSAMVLDGSRSSTLVAKRPGHRLRVENHPTNRRGVQRAVVDGLFVVVR